MYTENQLRDIMQRHFSRNGSDPDAVQGALFEAVQLHRTCSRQSEQLAQSLKEKNDWIGRYDTVRDKYDAAQEAIFKLQKDIEGMIPLSTYTESQAKVQLYAAQVVNLKKELVALRPPEPKFKVGQIVVKRECGASYTIRHNRFAASTWFYSNSREDSPVFPAYWERESILREQTAQEKGE